MFPLRGNIGVIGRISQIFRGTAPGTFYRQRKVVSNGGDLCLYRKTVYQGPEKRKRVVYACSQRSGRLDRPSDGYSDKHEQAEFISRVE